MLSNAIRIHTTGGPEVMRLEQVETPPPGRGEVLLRQTAIGVNFMDIYHRTGLYKQALPFGLGGEAAAVVEAVGDEVTLFKEGDRVAYAGGPPGAYAERRVYQADRLIPLPGWIEDQVAASSLLKGLTAEYLLRRTHKVQKGEWILIHAAAGATGGIMCQWAKALGAHVIGSVGGAAKVAVAEANGAEHVVVTSEPTGKPPCETLPTASASMSSMTASVRIRSTPRWNRSRLAALWCPSATHQVRRRP